MVGMVTVFNSYIEPMTNLLVSNICAGNIPGWSVGSNPPTYTPNSLSVPRSKYPCSTSVFAYGNNTLVFPWNSRTGITTIDIPVSTSLDDDLLIYLTQNLAILMSARGVVLSTSDVVTSLS